jgi:hypothetical protein
LPVVVQPITPSTMTKAKTTLNIFTFIFPPNLVW